MLGAFATAGATGVAGIAMAVTPEPIVTKLSAASLFGVAARSAALAGLSWAHWTDCQNDPGRKAQAAPGIGVRTVPAAGAAPPTGSGRPVDARYVAGTLLLGMLLSGSILLTSRRTGLSTPSAAVRAMVVFLLVQVALVPEWLRAPERSTDGWMPLVFVSLFLASIVHQFSFRPSLEAHA
jgi:hypothetical protein